MSIKLGMDAKAYYGEAGTTATTELTNIKDLTLNHRAYQHQRPHTKPGNRRGRRHDARQPGLAGYYSHAQRRQRGVRDDLGLRRRGVYGDQDGVFYKLALIAGDTRW